MFVDTDWNESFAVDRSPLVGVTPGTARRLHHIAPDARVVLVTCEPVTRAWSALNHENKVWLRSPSNNMTMLSERFSSADDLIDYITRSQFPPTHAGMVACMRTAGLGQGHTRSRIPLNTVCRELLLPGFYFDGLAQVRYLTCFMCCMIEFFKTMAM